MEKITSETINEIREKSDIVAVISSYIPLTKRGKNYFGICPFHDDNHPSMSVSVEKQIYKCFSCGAAGNVFTFVANYENISFIEAVKILGEKCGVHIDSHQAVAKHRHKHETLYQIYDLASKFYQNNMYSIEAKEAKAYLSKRQITEEMIKEFEIGLALKENTLLSRMLTRKHFAEEDLQKTGLLLKQDLDYKDLYYNRIMFPLYDLEGKIVGFSGRIYNMEHPSKYINTRETEIFKKGELLYFYHKAKIEARRTSKVIVMEGFMDVIRAYSIGIKNVVATMGTAVTKKQVHLIKKMAKEVILCFDGDEAGEKATLACADMLLMQGIKPKVVRLEENLDPDEYILKKGKEAFLSKLEHPMNIMDFKLKYFKKDKDLKSAEETSMYVKQMIEELSLIEDDIVKEVTLQKISEETSLSPTFLKERLEERQKNKKIELSSKKIEKTNNKQKKKITKYEKAENYLVYYMLQDKEVIKMYILEKPYLPDITHRMLALEIVHFYKEKGNIHIADLMSEISGEEELCRLLSQILLLNLKEEYTKEEIYDYFKVIREYNIHFEMNRLKKKMEEEMSPIEKAKLAQKIVELKVEESKK